MTPLTRHVGQALLLDLACIFVIAFAVYYRRYRRSDLVIAYVALNVSLFCVAVLIVNQMKIGVAFGFGLFAILSIIRLRSEPISPEEGAYYFVALVLGLINGMVFHDAPLARVLDVGIVAVMLVLDNGFIGVKARRQVVTLDTVYPDEGRLRLDLERRLGGKVKRLYVRETDYVRDTTVVDVRYVPITRDKGTRPWQRRATAAERDLHEVIA
ncbi:DUF4956 domain-containing protein [Nocardioides cynanchi]|uniref:DUF4956 domain-containing protein n=1 Tax=Nocardioides cynanchi TaxID=2558918 RepID=UPI001243CACE|nr:DUF4956 domain-containing protein [Nocardioides cynanchi]